MSYAKALRVVDVIAARNDTRSARIALAEVRSILEALSNLVEGASPPPPVAALLAAADPETLPAYVPPPMVEGAKRAQETKRERGTLTPNRWSHERREELFNYIGQGFQIASAAKHFDTSYQSIRYQVFENGDPKDPRFRHLKRLK